MSVESELVQQLADKRTRAWSLRLWVNGTVAEGTRASLVWVNNDASGRGLTAVRIGGFTWNTPIAEIPHGLWCAREVLREAIVNYPPSE